MHRQIVETRSSASKVLQVQRFRGAKVYNIVNLRDAYGVSNGLKEELGSALSFINLKKTFVPLRL